LDGEDAEEDEEDEWEEEDEWAEVNDDPVDIFVHEDVLPEPRPDGPAPR
jgi:hypothetical protein